jgi:hypothetical protein
MSWWLTAGEGANIKLVNFVVLLTYLFFLLHSTFFALAESELGDSDFQICQFVFGPSRVSGLL